MNLEDFKSFRRVLKPPEVGSIPTHSRHVPWGVALAAVLWAAGPAGAQEPVVSQDSEPAAAGETAEADETSEAAIRPGAMNRAIRSALFPAWGQVTNGKEVKAAVLFSAQTYVWARVLLETRKAREWERRAAQLTAEGASAAEISVADGVAENHFGVRRDLLFWAIFGGIYGALDAYIDAHLGEFDEDLEEGRALFAGVDPAEGELVLGFRF